MSTVLQLDEAREATAAAEQRAEVLKAQPSSSRPEVSPRVRALPDDRHGKPCPSVRDLGMLVHERWARTSSHFVIMPSTAALHAAPTLQTPQLI